jgi:aldehyde:ferredoxin oxidoreductase
MHNLPRVISSATGIDIDEAELSKITTRNRMLIRAVNVRRGMRREDEKPPEDHWKRRFPELEAQLLDEYYKFRGWNTQGIPTKESLDELGLDDISEDFLQRGILTDHEGGDSKKGSSEKGQNERGGGKP